MTCMQGIMGKFKKNTAMMTNQGIDVVVNKTEEPLLKLKKRAKPLKVSSNETATVLLKPFRPAGIPSGSMASVHIRPGGE